VAKAMGTPFALTADAADDDSLARERRIGRSGGEVLSPLSDS
jgi:hypothetical protein